MLEYHIKESDIEMASDDIYVRKDVYEADQRALRAEIRLGNEEVLKELRQFRVEINGKIEEVRTELNGKIADFREEVNGRFAEVNDKFAQVDKRFSQVDGRFDRLEAKVEVLTGRVDGLEKRMDGFENRLVSIQTYVGLGIAFVTMLITLYTFLAPIVKAAKNFLNNASKIESSSAVTVEQVREIFRAEAEAIISSKLQARQ